jgi:uncharacterized protein (TIGR02172 family)
VLGKLIAEGRTAEIYEWPDGQILKLFREGISIDQVKYEVWVTGEVKATGLPVPAVGELVEISGRFGFTSEQISGVSMLEIVPAKPWTLFQYARLLADLQTRMHHYVLPELPSLNQELERKIQAAQALSPALQQTALSVLARLPEEEQLCHGDFHPGNILITAGGPVIIDWNDATRGDPLADVARSSLLLSLAVLPPGLPAHLRLLLRLGRRMFHNLYLKRYHQLYPGGLQQLISWQPIVAAARLSNEIPAEREHLLALVKAGLAQVE